ncbi:MAG: SGNH/GDSL hydrolase family protein [Actinomycetota bacterium]
MRRWIRISIVGMTMMLVASVAASASAGPDLVPGNPAYLALGDSWAYGQGASSPATGGYVARLAEDLTQSLDCLPAESNMAADGCEHLQVLNLARPARDGLPGVTAPLVRSEQLPLSVALLAERNGDSNPRDDVEAVTLHVGGNDVSGPIQAACLGGFTPECQYTWFTEMATFEADLRSVVGPLRAAAGADTPIVLGTYDNPVPYCWLGATYGAPAVGLGAMILEGTPDGSLDGIHDVVRRVAADYDADVAEVFGRLGPGDFVGGSDCLHMTDTGHVKVAAIFAEILES